MAARTRDTRQTRLKRQVARNSYTVDPRQVATAIIVKLVQETTSSPDPFSSGPTRSAGSAGPFRRAA